MTAADKNSIRFLGGLALALIVPALIALFSAAWTSKESVEHHNADIGAIQSSVQRILDVVCADRKDARACHQ